MWEDLADGRLEASVRRSLLAHQAGCRSCSEFAHRSQHQRRALRGLSPKAVPVQVAVGLRVLASKERARRSARVDWVARLGVWRGQARLWLNNLWRPLAIPAAGGVASACILFAALMPTFALQGGASADVPTAWYQSAEVNALSPFGVDADDVTLLVRIDTSGRVIDYNVPADESGHWRQDPELRRAVENSLLFMSFKPASFFGQPASDTIRVTLRRSRIEVKG
jgi:anti-sigma factor RsiW